MFFINTQLETANYQSNARLKLLLNMFLNPCDNKKYKNIIQVYDGKVLNLVNPISHGVSDSVAPMGGGLGGPPPSEIKEGVIFDPMLL